ncbi:MAG: RDD family protein [Ignavibacteriota bacterium]
MATGIDPDVRYCSQCGQPSPLDRLARFGDTLVCPNCKNSYVQKLREGVAPFRPAFVYGGFWIRFVAVLIDGIILGVASSAVQLLLLGSMVRPIANMREPLPPDQALAAFGAVMGTLAVSMLVSMAIGASYEGFFISRAGATPGKMVFGLKVVRPNGAPVTLGRAIGRYFAKGPQLHRARHWIHHRRVRLRKARHA